MPDFLPPEARAQLEQMLQSEGGAPGGELSPEQQQALAMQGAQQAQAELEGAAPDGAAAGAPMEDPAMAAQGAPVEPAQPTVDPNAEILASTGFQNVQELADAFSQLAEANEQMRGEMNQLLGFQQALGNTDELDPNDPNAAVKRVFREMMGPLADEVQSAARNRAIAAAWNLDAKGMADFEALRPEIDAYLQGQPDLAIRPDGLRQAYHAVRSGKYVPEDKLLSDPKAVERFAENSAVKDAVIKKYLAGLRQNGEIPPSVGAGGSVPLTGTKGMPKTIDEATERMRALMGS